MRGDIVLTRRIIPCFDVDQGRVVKGISFVNLRDAGDPVELAAKYQLDGADELVFLDITASSCLLYTSPSPRDGLRARMPSSA